MNFQIAGFQLRGDVFAHFPVGLASGRVWTVPNDPFDMTHDVVAVDLLEMGGSAGTCGQHQPARKIANSQPLC